MDDFDTIDIITGGVFQVTWDIGRRCNYDCSYCPPHRHDNFSEHFSLDALIKTATNLFEYIRLYNKYRGYKKVSICLTGGEPTINPDFIPFIKYLRETYDNEFKDEFKCGLAVTTNGAMSEKVAQALLKYFNYATISYHSEADPKLKRKILERIEYMNKNKGQYFDLKVNVMFHALYFDECKDVCNYLLSKNIDAIPRIIGEEPNTRSEWAHSYTEEQLQWMKDFWKNDTNIVNKTKRAVRHVKLMAEDEVKTPEPKKAICDKDHNKPKEKGSNIGRPCCGLRTLSLSKGEGKNEEKTKTRFVTNRRFKGWHCGVNWYFVHLEQQIDAVFHHQTCQARFDQTRGPIGKISEFDKLIEDLQWKLENQKMETVICPKWNCGCGICVPKSKFGEKYFNVIEKHIDKSVLNKE